jgi:hypothetical protein
MYVTRSPNEKHFPRNVVVIERKDVPYNPGLADCVITLARVHGATSHRDQETFFLVFEGEPKRIVDMTEHVLRRELRTKQK